MNIYKVTNVIFIAGPVMTITLGPREQLIFLATTKLSASFRFEVVYMYMYIFLKFFVGMPHNYCAFASSVLLETVGACQPARLFCSMFLSYFKFALISV